MSIASAIMIKLGVDVNTQETQAKMSKMARSLRRQGRQIALTGRELTMGVTAPIIGIAGAALKAHMDLEKLKKGLKRVAGSQKEFNRQWSNLQEIAKRPGIGFEDAIQLSIGLQSAGQSAKFAEKFMGGLANAVSLGAGGAQEFQRAMNQVNQSLAKGKVEAQDWKIIRENAPVTQKVMADIFGTTDIKAAMAGRTVKEFWDIMASGMEGLGEGPQTLANSWQNFGTAVKLAMADLGEEISKTINLKKILSELAIKLRELVDWFKQLSPTMKKSIIYFAGFAAVMGPLLVVLGNVILAFGQVYATIRNGFMILNKAKKLWGVARGMGSLSTAAGAKGVASAAGSSILGGMAAVLAIGLALGAAIAGLGYIIDRVTLKWASSTKKWQKNLRVIWVWVKNIALAGGGVRGLANAVVENSGEEMHAKRGGYLAKGAQSKQAGIWMKNMLQGNDTGFRPLAGETDPMTTGLASGGDDAEQAAADAARRYKIALYKSISDAKYAVQLGDAIKGHFDDSYDIAQDNIAGFGGTHAPAPIGSVGIKSGLPSVGAHLANQAKKVIISKPQHNAPQNLGTRLWGQGMSGADKAGVVTSGVETIGGEIFARFAEMTANKLAVLENYYNRERELIENSQMTEEQKAAAIAKLDKKTDMQRQKLQKKQAKQQKAQAIFQAIIGTANAIIQMLAGGPIVGQVLAGIAATIGASQIATIAAQPLPLAKGGIVGGNTYAQIGEYMGARNNPEVVAPLNMLKSMLGQQAIMVYGRLEADGEKIYALIENKNRDRFSSGGPYFSQSF